MNQIDEMDNFLKYCAKIYIQNPTIEVQTDTVLDKLRYYGLRTSDTKEKISRDRVEALIHGFDRSRLSVYIHPKMPDYIQFHTPGFEDSKLAKLYVSAPKEYIDYVASRIFHFIDKKKIDCNAKVATNVRTDNIVIRIQEKDVKTVVDFINKDKNFTDLLQYNNPFAFRAGKISLAYDDLLTYNYVVSGFISKYLFELKKSNRLESASLEDFTKFYNQYYQDVFVNGSRVREYTATMPYQTLRTKSVSRDAYFNNHAEIAGLFLTFINNQLDLDQYTNFVSRCNDAEMVDRNIERYNKLVSQPIRPDYTKEAQSLLNEYIVYMMNKHQDATELIFSLEGFLNISEAYITRDNNFRTRFASIDKKTFSSIMHDNPKLYIETVLGMVSISLSDTDKYNLFTAAMAATANKYGVEHLDQAIRKMLDGDFGSITNESNYRLQLFKEKEYFNRDTILYFCSLYLSSKGYNMNVVEDVINTYAMHIGYEYGNKQAGNAK